MIYKLQNKKIQKLLEEKKVLFDEIQVINERIVEDDKARKKLTYKSQRLKEKMMPLMKKYYKDGTIKINPPIEIPTSIHLEGNTIEVEVVDQVEEYKKILLEKDKQSKK